MIGTVLRTVLSYKRDPYVRQGTLKKANIDSSAHKRDRTPSHAQVAFRHHLFLAMIPPSRMRPIYNKNTFPDHSHNTAKRSAA